ncbi:hypothetical protein [Streptomyces sp. NPDC058045]|uniref:hypothetical protein n=1 Tax=Streptomyces sp. NPDC058045 TaxID=3346311 RepID=UPI0036E0EBA8
MSAIALRRSRVLTLVSTVCAGLLATGTLAGCGGGSSGGDPDAGTNGAGKLTAAKIQAKARSAAQAARTVRLSGTVVSNGHPYRLDMRLTGDGGSGAVTFKGRTFRLLRVGEHLYLKADAEFWQQRDGEAKDSAAAQKLDGKYVKVPQGDPAYDQLSVFTSKKDLLGGLLTLHGTLRKGDRGRTGMVRTVAVQGDKGAGGTLDVSLEGKPYPVRLKRAGNAGTLSLTDWNRGFDLKEPADSDTLDYGQQLPTS